MHVSIRQLSDCKELVIVDTHTHLRCAQKQVDGDGFSLSAQSVFSSLFLPALVVLTGCQAEKGQNTLQQRGFCGH